MSKVNVTPVPGGQKVKDTYQNLNDNDVALAVGINDNQDQIDALVVGSSDVTIGVHNGTDNVNTNNYTATTGVATRFDKFKILLEVANTNTGNATLNDDGRGAKPIKRWRLNGVLGELEPGELKSAFLAWSVTEDCWIMIADSGDLNALTPKQLGGGILINGDFKIRQDGDSFVGVAVGAYDADQHVTTPEGGAVIDISFPSVQDGDLPFAQYHRANLTTAGTSSNKSKSIELKKLKQYAGKTLVFSYYARAEKNVDNISSVFLASGLTGTISIVGASVNQITTDWARYSFKISIGTDLGGNDDTSYLLIQYIRLNDGGAFGIGWIDSSATRLEVGTSPTEYIPKSFDEDLNNCKYYYEKFGYGFLSVAQNSTTITFSANYNVEKRINPTITLTKDDPIMDNAPFTGVFTGVSSSVVGYETNKKGARFINVDGFTGLSPGDILVLSAGQGDLFIANARL